jgi:prepilin peptidase CpaA
MIVAITLATFVIGGVWSIGLAVLRRRTLQLYLNLAAILGGGFAPARVARAGAALAPGQLASIGSLPYGVAIAAGTLGMLFIATA